MILTRDILNKDKSEQKTTGKLRILFEHNVKIDNFENKFKIIKKGFRFKKDRERTEAFMIRTKLPSINDQFDHKAFKLF